MAYRRRQGISRVSTFKEEIRHPTDDYSSSSSSSSSSSTSSSSSLSSSGGGASSSSSSSSGAGGAASASGGGASSSLAAQAIRHSSAHRDSSLSSAYGEHAFASSYRDKDPGHHRQTSFPARRDPASHEFTPMRSFNESRFGLWNVLAKKAKSILEDDNVSQEADSPGRDRPLRIDSPGDEFHQSHQAPVSSRRRENPSLQKGLDALTSSLNYIGGTIGNAVEEGLTIVENRTAEMRKLQIRNRSSNFEQRTHLTDICSRQQQIQMQTDQETQLKASRDVAMAMTAKAKLLLRELKQVKADLAFAKERCAQLEEENKMLRDRRDKGDGHEDDDLIRLQLETLLNEKSRLATENFNYARENRFLHEVVEYHQLTMQDLVYLDEGFEEVKEVCPISIPDLRDRCSNPSPPPPPPPPHEGSPSANSTPVKDIVKDIYTDPKQKEVVTVPPDSVASSSFSVQTSAADVPSSPSSVTTSATDVPSSSSGVTTSAAEVRNDPQIRRHE